MYKINKVIKKLLKRVIIEEKGQVIPLALIMLVLGSTIVAGTLTYAATTSKASSISKSYQMQIYAADAGAKDAIWRFKNDNANITGNIGVDEWIYKPSPLNEQDMEVTAAYVENGVYWITSEAYREGTATTVDLLLSGVSVFFTYPAVGAGSIDDAPAGVLVPPKKLPDYGNFPTAADLRAYYLDESEPHQTLTHTSINTINTDSDPTEGWMYYEDGLTIEGTGTLTLDGNLYIVGDLNLANEEFTIDFGGHTIYIAKDDVDPDTGQIIAKQKTGLIGPGCLIAEGDITMMPNMEVSGSGQFVLIMSVEGEVTLQPNGNFYGSVAAGGTSGQGISITMQPGATVNLTTIPDGGLDFLDDPSTYEWSVSNWRSKHELVLYIITSVYAPGEDGIPYSQTTIAKNGVPQYYWTITQGTLPDGLNLDANTGIISGTPTEYTNFPSPIFTLQVTDNQGDTATRDMTIAIYPELNIPAQTFEGQVGVEFSQEIICDDGVEPYSQWTIAAGSLPDGLELNIDTGEISGIPTVECDCSFSVSVTDALGVVDIQIITITIVP